MFTPTRLALATVLSLAFTPVAAQDFQKAYDAFLAGDYATALQEWTPLADQGVADAQFYLGLMYKNGQGVTQDHAEAFKWYRLAANQGVADAQFYLGSIHILTEDYAEAVKWRRLAAEQGHAFAQYSLGTMYKIGMGVLQDNVMAHMWYNLASANGRNGAGEERDELAGEMTTVDISKAQAMARECMNSGYRKCEY
jgi:TPR repeat protein